MTPLSDYPMSELLAEVRRRQDLERARLLRRDKRRATPLTRTERHQIAADRGVDTWEEMRGEK